MNPVQRIKEEFAEDVLHVAVHRGQETVYVKRDRILAILSLLKEDKDLSFGYLADLAGADHLEFPYAPERYAVAYHLYSFPNRRWQRVKAMVPEEDPWIDSAVELWPAANWLEREVYDLFGISFRGHPDLRRILMPEDFPGHPLRRDYPLKGMGYRERFRKVTGAAAGDEKRGTP
ncbi:MAG: NADH-quinone oxidoreductase subunit C [Planctomycetes bacterium]|nr:NADH-quinone oxidoreductase subunit C [Planctomycetota bacterium]